MSINETFEVLGYLKPSSAFHTLNEWQNVVERLLALQEEGVDTRGGVLPSDERLLEIIDEYFGYQLKVEVERWDLLTVKNVLDFIEDFVNHRFWSFENEYGNYFPDIMKLRFAFFYSRGDLEPYVMLDEEFTTQLYGSTYNPKGLCHYTTEEGLQNLIRSIESGINFDISCFTVMDRPFFRPLSNILVELVGNVRAGFRSDVKSIALDDGRRACNMYRLEYPGRDTSNICFELDSCDASVKTSLWNEYIATPIQIIDYQVRNSD